jgi:hypothetical protein
MAAVIGTEWEARPLAWPARAAPGARWGIEHRPTGRRVAVGSAARCRRLAAQLAEVDAILTRHGSPPVPAAGRAGRGRLPGRA